MSSGSRRSWIARKWPEIFDAVPNNVLYGIDGQLYFIDTQYLQTVICHLSLGCADLIGQARRGLDTINNSLMLEEKYFLHQTIQINLL